MRVAQRPPKTLQKTNPSPRNRSDLEMMPVSYELILPPLMTGFFPTSPVASLKWKSREENLEVYPGGDVKQDTKKYTQGQQVRDGL